MLKNSPTISIVMPLYNEDINFFTKALESIFSQSFKKFELIIVDDSSDLKCHTHILKNFGNDPRLKYYKNNKRMGLAKSLNLGLLYCSGDYVCRMDSDDIATVDRLECQLAFLKEHKNIDVVGSNINLIDKESLPIGFRKYPETNEEFRKKLHFTSPIAHPTVMFRRQVYMKYGGYIEKFNRAEDLDLWLRWSNLGVSFANIQQPLLFYRMISPERTLAHWISNLTARLTNFSRHMLLRRVVGIAIITTWILVPSSIQRTVYRYVCGIK